MKKTIFLSLITISLLAFKMPTATWTFDEAHSNLRFSVELLKISDVEGSFIIKQATLEAPNDDNFTDAKVTLTADVKSIDTDNEGRDKHLQSPDFFDAEKYPDITFTSTSFKKVNDKKYAIKGDLTFHGITKPVTLDAVANLGTSAMNNKTVVGFRVSGVIKRSDYGIGEKTPPAMLSDEVHMKANVQFAKS